MPQVNVARLHDDNREALSLAWIAGRDSGTAVRSDAAAAAALIGHLNLTHPNSIQVIGAYEAGMVAGFVERLFEIGRASCRERASRRGRVGPLRATSTA